MANWLGDFGRVFVSVPTYMILFGSWVVCVCVCVCVCVWNGQLEAECPLESLPTRAVISSSQSPPLLEKKTPFKTGISFGKDKIMVMGPDVTRNQDCAGEDRQQFDRPAMSEFALGWQAKPRVCASL
jgi:hypothetical protein